MCGVDVLTLDEVVALVHGRNEQSSATADAILGRRSLLWIDGYVMVVYS